MKSPVSPPNPLSSTPASPAASAGITAASAQAQSGAPAAGDDLDFSPIQALALAAFGCEWTALETMPGGASTRRYFRLTFAAPAKNFPALTSAVAMFVPDGLKPEEIDNGNKGTRWPFLEVHELLQERGVDVPAVLGEDPDRGWLLLEDLGERTLAQVLQEAPGKKNALYKQAVADLAFAQHHLASLPESSIVNQRSFDEALLYWEIDHFREWGLEARGINLAADDAALFEGIARRLAARVAAFPRTFVHRDYQSRNLMVRTIDGQDTLVWIDFQDALLGPRVYDLVALLGDSYQEFDRNFVEARIAEFGTALGLSEKQKHELMLEFDLCTVQRKLKDAGRFVFIDRVKKNPSFLRFVTPTIGKVRASLERLLLDEDMRNLHALLARTLKDEFAL